MPTLGVSSTTDALTSNGQTTGSRQTIPPAAASVKTPKLGVSSTTDALTSNGQTTGSRQTIAPAAASVKTPNLGVSSATDTFVSAQVSASQSLPERQKNISASLRESPQTK